MLESGSECNARVRRTDSTSCVVVRLVKITVEWGYQTSAATKEYINTYLL